MPANFISAPIRLNWQREEIFRNFIEQHKSRSMKQVLYQKTEYALTYHKEEVLQFINHDWFSNFFSNFRGEKPDNWTDLIFYVHISRDKYPILNEYWYSQEIRGVKSFKLMLIFNFIFLNIDKNNSPVVGSKSNGSDINKEVSNIEEPKALSINNHFNVEDEDDDNPEFAF